MKKLIYLFILLPFIANGQITLEHTFQNESPNPSGQVILFSNNGEKIIMVDTGSNIINLYNTDYTLWKTIIAPSYSGYTLGYVLAMSDNLFNNDNAIEMMVVYYNYSSSSTYKSAIIDETGNVIQDLGNAYYGSIHLIDGVYKLMTIIPGINQTYGYSFYSLPGTMPCGQCGSLGVQRPAGSSEMGTSYVAPNPSENAASIYYNLPMGIQHPVLDIYDASGKVVEHNTLDPLGRSVSVSYKNLSAGIYYYTITAANMQPVTNKLVVNK